MCPPWHGAHSRAHTHSIVKVVDPPTNGGSCRSMDRSERKTRRSEGADTSGIGPVKLLVPRRLRGRGEADSGMGEEGYKGEG